MESESAKNQTSKKSANDSSNEKGKPLGKLSFLKKSNDGETVVITPTIKKISNQFQIDPRNICLTDRIAMYFDSEKGNGFAYDLQTEKQIPLCFNKGSSATVVENKSIIISTRKGLHKFLIDDTEFPEIPFEFGVASELRVDPNNETRFFFYNSKSREIHVVHSKTLLPKLAFEEVDGFDVSRSHFLIRSENTLFCYNRFDSSREFPIWRRERDPDHFVISFIDDQFYYEFERTVNTLKCFHILNPNELIKEITNVDDVQKVHYLILRMKRENDQSKFVFKILSKNKEFWTDELPVAIAASRNRFAVWESFGRPPEFYSYTENSENYDENEELPIEPQKLIQHTQFMTRRAIASINNHLSLINTSLADILTESGQNFRRIKDELREIQNSGSSDSDTEMHEEEEDILSPDELWESNKPAEAFEVAMSLPFSTFINFCQNKIDQIPEIHLQKVLTILATGMNENNENNERTDLVIEMLIKIASKIEPTNTILQPKNIAEILLHQIEIFKNSPPSQKNQISEIENTIDDEAANTSNEERNENGTERKYDHVKMANIEILYNIAQKLIQ